MLTNKHLVVTGASGILGSAVIAEALAQGASVSALDRHATSSEPHVGVTHHTVDLLDLESLRETIGQLPKVDAVMNIAGGFSMGPTVYAEGDDEWNLMMKLNVETLRNMLKVVTPHMIEQGGGAIVNVGAYGAREGQASMSAYGVSKSAVMRLTESLSAEVKTHGINVNAVLPTIIDTPANRESMPDADPSGWVAPRDLARVMCFLGSDHARAIHGALVPVTGLV
ncbi:MAG: SDR family NAD(P)-dependent oxidoreductase [Pseudomonadota bacterium]